MYQDPYQQHVLFGIVQTPTRAQTITFPCQPPLSASSSYPLEPPASPRDARLAGLQYSTTLPINAPTRRPKRDSIGVGKEGGGGFGEGLEAKIVLLGSPAVGKTSLIKRYCSKKFDMKNNSVTINTSLMTKKLEVQGVSVRMQIWDTAGQERFRSMAPMYYRGAHAAILVYDVTSMESFRALKSWLAEIKESMPDDAIIQVVGAKSDLEAKREVSILEAKRLLREWLRPPSPRSPKPSPTPPPTLVSRPSLFSSHRGSGFRVLSRPDPVRSDSSSRDPDDTRHPTLPPACKGWEFPELTTPRHTPLQIPLNDTNSSVSSSNDSTSANSSGFIRQHSARTYSTSTAASFLFYPSSTASTATSTTTVITSPSRPSSGDWASGFATALAERALSPTGPPADYQRSRRKSEEWGRKTPEVSAALGGGTSGVGGQPIASASVGFGKRGTELRDVQREEEDEIELPDGIRVWECSALKDAGIDRLFLHVAKDLIRRGAQLQFEAERRQRESVFLHDDEAEGAEDSLPAGKKKKNGCCV